MENQKELLTTNSRTIYYDYLRIFATLAVITLHVACREWHTCDVNELNWKIFNFYNAIVRWSVPVFIMISGSLFLKREISISKMCSKYILRLFVAFAIWYIIYFLLSNNSYEKSFFSAMRSQYHLWFLPMIMGIYFCVPIIKSIVLKRNIGIYFCCLSFLFWILIPSFIVFIKDFWNDSLLVCACAFERCMGIMNMNFLMSYIFYFVLGYYLSDTFFDKKQTIIIYLIGVIGFAFTIFVSELISVKLQTPSGWYYGYSTLNVFLEALAVFVLFKSISFKKEYKFIVLMSKWSFGAYCVHALILEHIYLLNGLNVLSFSPWLSVPVITLIVFVISFVISALLNHIPIVKKYMV